MSNCDIQSRIDGPRDIVGIDDDIYSRAGIQRAEGEKERKVKSWAIRMVNHWCAQSQITTKASQEKKK